MTIRKGFTLIEVLVTLSVLSIVLLGIYSVTRESINITQYSKDRAFLVDKGYERILMHIHYPRVSLPNSEPYGADSSQTIKYEYTNEETLLPSVISIKLKTVTDKAAVTYIYFGRE